MLSLVSLYVASLYSVQAISDLVTPSGATARTPKRTLRLVIPLTSGASITYAAHEGVAVKTCSFWSFAWKRIS